MHKFIKRHAKRIAYDVGGGLLIIIGIIIGPLPGPGATILIPAGLGLLAVHNEWAHRLLHFVQQHTSHLRQLFFPNKPLIQALWDIAAAVALATGVILQTIDAPFIVRGLGAAAITGSFVLFLFNRNRITFLDRFFRRSGRNK